MSTPRDAVAAATHPDPYAYYAALAAGRPLVFDRALGMWVAASAAAVTAALTDARCRVRPAAEPVPVALLGSPAGDLFARLVRMTDDVWHDPVKRAVTAALASVADADVAALSRRWARLLLPEGARDGAPVPRTDFAFALPTFVLGNLLGIPECDLDLTARWLHDFVRCLAPGSNPDEIEQGKIAAGELRAMMRALLESNDPASGSNLLPTLALEMAHAGYRDTDLIVANAIGFLSQAYEATAGLIGNTFLALTADPALRERIIADPGLLEEVIAGVLRLDPPIQNTRRFVAQDGDIAGQQMLAGDTILVLLAAANRDPAANPDPSRLDIARKDRQTFAFGVGAHGCPGAALAVIIAAAGVQRLLETGDDRRPRTGPVVYRRSANARVPLWIGGRDQ